MIWTRVTSWTRLLMCYIHDLFKRWLSRFWVTSGLRQKNGIFIKHLNIQKILWGGLRGSCSTDCALYLHILLLADFNGSVWLCPGPQIRDIIHWEFNLCGFVLFEVILALWGKIIRGLYRIISPKGCEDIVHYPPKVAVWPIMWHFVFATLWLRLLRM